MGQNVDNQQGFLAFEQKNINMPQSTGFSASRTDSSACIFGQNNAAQQHLQSASQSLTGDLNAVPTAVGQPSPGTWSLSNMSAEDQQKILAEVHAGIVRQITDDQIKNLKAEAQVNIMKQLSPEQIKEIQQQAELAIM